MGVLAPTSSVWPDADTRPPPRVSLLPGRRTGGGGSNTPSWRRRRGQCPVVSHAALLQARDDVLLEVVDQDLVVPVPVRPEKVEPGVVAPGLVLPVRDVAVRQDERHELVGHRPHPPKSRGLTLDAPPRPPKSALDGGGRARPAGRVAVSTTFS